MQATLAYILPIYSDYLNINAILTVDTIVLICDKLWYRVQILKTELKIIC